MVVVDVLLKALTTSVAVNPVLPKKYLILPKDQVYNSKKLARHLLDHALYTAFAPYDNPEYVATVVIEHGNGGSKSERLISEKCSIMHLSIKRPEQR
ncbi:hypothetical protein O9929_25575 [Vibrio lentus]|nr:hypothetical protein [Vibrio lentus]